jgi:hypothetical protein
MSRGLLANRAALAHTHLDVQEAIVAEAGRGWRRNRVGWAWPTIVC